MTTTVATTNKNLPVGIVLEGVQKETKDLYLAAAFDAEGVRFIEIDKTDKTRMIFKFEGGEHANNVEKQWWNNSLVVSATAYAASIRKFKSLIHS